MKNLSIYYIFFIIEVKLNISNNAHHYNCPYNKLRKLNGYFKRKVSFNIDYQLIL